MNTDISPAQRAAALEGSIAKWRAIVERTGKDEGSENCPLCQTYWSRSFSCEGCPVSERTGMSMCRGTPYLEYCNEANMEQKGRGDPDETDVAARAMLAFLESLREPTAVMRSVEMAPTDADGSPLEVRRDEGVGA